MQELSAILLWCLICAIVFGSAIAGLVVLVYGVKQKDWTLVVGGILLWIFMGSLLVLIGAIEQLGRGWPGDD